LCAGVRVAERRNGIAAEGIAVDLKCGVGAGDLAVEVAAEVGRARPQPGAQALALGVAHFAEPAVLQCAQHREERDERGRRHARPERPAPPFTLRRNPARATALYMSYKTLAER